MVKGRLKRDEGVQTSVRYSGIFDKWLKKNRYTCYALKSYCMFHSLDGKHRKSGYPIIIYMSDYVLEFAPKNKPDIKFNYSNGQFHLTF